MHHYTPGLHSSNLAFDHEAEPFEEDLDRPIKGRLQNCSHV